ncbi:MAG TPA: 4Fe-4S binding protein [Kiritimatiellae bacterium]|nr:4Fe-4S binding protein [Kiritimatiellia bacterium]
MKMNHPGDHNWSRGFRIGAFAVGLGLFSLSAQTLLFRAFLVVFEGNELATGCFFASWLVWVAVGAVLGRALARREVVLRYLDLAAAVFYPAALVLQRGLLLRARELSGVEPYELFPLLQILPPVVIFNAPVSILTGTFFTLACQWAAGTPQVVSRVYVWEAIGAFLGGVGTTLLLSAGVTDENVLLLSIAILAALVIPVARAQDHRAAAHRLHRVVSIMVLIGAVLLLGSGQGSRWGYVTWRNKYLRLIPGARYRGQFTTPQARYLYGTYRNQLNVVAWESVVESIPDEEHAAKVTALTLAQCPTARRVLVVGCGSFAICDKFLELPQIQTVTWLHPDPQYTRRLVNVLNVLSGFTPDQRLRLPSEDVRRYLEKCDEQYDLIIVNLPDPTTLVLNRYFTLEFFRLLRMRLADGGQVAVRTLGGENVMGSELVSLGASILVTFERVLGRSALKPGDETWIIGGTPGKLSESADLLVRRYAAIAEAEHIYPPPGLRTLYREDRIRFQRESYAAAIRMLPADWLVNRDRHPMALLYTLLFALRHTVWTGKITLLLPRLGGPVRAGALAGSGMLIVFLLRLVFRVRAPRTPGGGASRTLLSRRDAAWTVFSTGAAGLAACIILMFLLQARYGSLFLLVGLLSSLFMLGIFLGGALVTYLLDSMTPRRLLPAVVLSHAGLLLFIAWSGSRFSFAAFAVLFLLVGAFGGMYVPVCAAVMQRAGSPDRHTAFVVEAADHLGGAAGGLLVATMLLPVLGSPVSTTLLAMLVATNLAVPLAAFVSGRWRGSRGDGQPTWRFEGDSRIRTAGYFMAGTALFALVGSLLLVRPDPWEQGLRRASAVMLPGEAEVRPETKTFQGKRIAYLRYRIPRTSEEGYVLLTHGLADDIAGYAGPLVLGMRLTAEGELRDFVVLHSDETPAYLDQATKWARRFIGRNLFRTSPAADVDSLTGATLTSRALAGILHTTGLHFASLLRGRSPRYTASTTRHVEKSALVLVVVAVAALVFRIFPRRVPRLVVLVGVALLFGWRLNLQYSSDHLLLLVGGHFPSPGLVTGFVLAVGLLLLVMLVGNLYCGQLCPFGALQELVERLTPASWKLQAPLRLRARLRYVKFVLLWLLVMVYLATGFRQLAAADPLTRIFARPLNHRMVIVLLVIAGVSAIVPRFWCRYLCVPGALLSFISGLNPLSRRMWRIRPPRCPYAVVTREDLDCLGCDRCRRGSAVARGDEAGNRASLLLVLLVSVAVLWVTGRAVRTTMPVEKPVSRIPAPESPARPTRRSRGVRKIDERRIRRMIRQGELSDKKAKYYERLPHSGLPSGDVADAD